MFIHGSNALSFLKHILHTHGYFRGVCDYCHLGFHLLKNVSTHFLITHVLPAMRAASADLDTLSAAADAALGDVRAADGDQINGTILKKLRLLFCCSRHT